MIICEISQNFSNLAEARELVRLAKENGGDLVKAQLFDSMKLYGKHTPSELSFKQAKMLFDYGSEIGIEVFFSVFDVERVRWCEEIGVRRYKIACASQDDWHVQLAVALTGKEVIQSLPYGKRLTCDYLKLPRQIAYLFCIPQYPASLESAFSDLWFEEYDASTRSIGVTGYSDHTIGLDDSKIALARGAQIIEKHFCLDHDLGIDAVWSMDATELRELKRWEIVCNEVL